MGVASNTFCPTKIGQVVDATFKLVAELDLLPTLEQKDSTVLDDEKVVSIPTPIPHIEFVIPGKFNEEMESTTSMFSFLPTVVLDLKQACIQCQKFDHSTL